MFSHNFFKRIFSLISIFAILFNTLIPVALSSQPVVAQEPPAITPVPTLEPPKQRQELAPSGVPPLKTAPITPTITPTPTATALPDKSPAEQPPPPSPNHLPPEVEGDLAREAIQTALDKYLRYLGPRYHLTLPDDIAIDGDWAYAPAQWQSTARLSNEPIHILAHRLPDGTWQALLPDGEGMYAQWVDEAPEGLISAEEKEGIHSQANAITALYPPPPALTVPPMISVVTGLVKQPSNPSAVGPTPAPVLLGQMSDAVVEVDFSWFETIPDEIKQEITETLAREGHLFTDRTYFVLTVFQEYQNTWVNAAVVAPDSKDWISAQGFPGTELLLKNTSSGWYGHIAEAPEYGRLQFQVPKDFIDYSYLTQQNLGIKTAVTHKFPWKSGETWNLTQGWHGAGFWVNNNLDFTPPGSTTNDVLSSAGGTLMLSCPGGTDNQQVAFVIKHSDNTRTEYLHIDKSTARLDLVNQTVSQGQYLGDIYTKVYNPGPCGSWQCTFRTDCGYGTGPHLHFGLDNKNATIESYNANDIGNWLAGSQFTSHNDGNDPCSAPSLDSPNNGAVINDADRRVTLDWDTPSSCPGLDVYTYRVVDNPNYIDSGPWIIDGGVDAPQTNKEVQLSQDGDYWWAIWPCQGCTSGNPSYGDRSEVRRFRIEPGSPAPTDEWSAKYYIGHDCWNDTGPSCADAHKDYSDTIPSPGDDRLIDKMWTSSPGGNVGDDNWTGLFETTVNFSNDEYVFYAIYDDAIRLEIDDYGLKGPWEYNGYNLVQICNGDSGFNLNGDTPIRVFLREDSGDAYVMLQYDTDTSVCTPSTPSPPTLQAPANGATFNEGQSINLSWSDTGDDYFGEVWGGPAGTSTFGWQSGTSKNIGSQWAGYTYSWHIKARNSGGESGWSSTRTFIVRPATPTNLNAQTASCNQINLTWSDNSGNEAGYRIYRNGSYLAQVGANTTSYQNTGLSGDTAYSYYVKAYRGSIESGASNTVNISTPPCSSPEPDLVPTQWNDWQYPIVPAAITGTYTVTTLYAGYVTYIDWGLSNVGSANSGGTSYGELYIDNTRVGYYNFGDVSPGQQWAFIDWTELITSPGWHTLKVVVDPDDLIAESDETNNTWEHQFYWTPTAPYSDDIEDGPNNWSATGLWHQVGYGDPYPAWHSWSHSWWYGQDTTGDYDTGSENSGSLTSPSIYIPDTGYYLRFWYWYETETQAPTWDQRLVQISVDGGPFSTILQLYDDPMNWWLQSPVIDLSAYAGHSIQVRFYFDTLDSTFNTYRGWYIDDVDISTTPPPGCADTHEPNNLPGQATAISYGQTLSADLCPGADYDYYQFSGTAGDKVVIDVDAKVNGSLLDSYIFLLADDGTTVLSANDDEVLGQVQDAHLGYTLPYTGAYYIKLKAWDHPSAGGPDHFYTISLFTDYVVPSSVEITSPIDNDWLNTISQTVSVSAFDAESGIRRVSFWWHDADWENSDWIWLGADEDSRDGWQMSFDTNSLAEQQGGAFYVYAYDWANNWASTGSWNLGLDRTPPTTTVQIQPMYGNAPFRDFWVTWWNSTDNLSGIASYDIQYRDGAGGVWTDLVTDTLGTYTRFVGQDGHTYYFRSRADDNAGNQSNYAGGDGDTQHTVTVCAVSPDGYEGDDDYSVATNVNPDLNWQTHNFHDDGDEDWLQFSAVASTTYILETRNTGGHADTIITVYDSDGTTILASNDDAPDDYPASWLRWTPDHNGTFYVKVNHWDPYAYGCTTEYTVRIRPALRTSGEWQQIGEGGFGTRRTEYVTALGAYNNHLYAGALNFDTGAQLWRNDSSWTPVTTNGFDHPYNQAVDHLFEFNGQLYAGLWTDDFNGGELWRTADELTWTRVVSGGFGDPTNGEIFRLAEFNNQLYASTWSYTSSHGTEIWRSSSGNAASWSQVVSDGFGDSNNTSAMSMVVHNGYLYASTRNTATGGEIWRSANGSSWSQVNDDGFSITNTWAIPALTVFNNALYAGTATTASGGQLWRCTLCDGSDWEQVVGDGFGDSSNSRIDGLIVFDDELYAITSNFFTGMQIWSSADGITWGQANLAGFEDSENWGPYWNNSAVVINDTLYVGTWNTENGGEIWQKVAHVDAVANFTASPTSGIAPLSVDFSDASSGDYDTVAWDFGDGGTSNQSNPSHTYNTPGIYTVILTVSGLGGTDVLSRTNYITVYAPVQANFTASPTSGIAPLSVDFSDGSSGDYDTVAWDFGDGGTSNQSNPSHTYITPGSYSVSLSVSGPGGSDVRTRTNYIIISPPLADHAIYLPLVLK